MSDAASSYIIDTIFPRHEVHLTGGASGSGKTTLEAQLIESWRKGEDVFGYRSYPAPFCYVACDRSLQSIHATLARVGVKFSEWPLISLINTHIQRTIPSILVEARKLVPDLQVLWLDGIHSLCPKGRINDYDVVSHFLIETTRLCQKEDLTIKSLGHATKVREGEGFLNPRHRFLGSVAWGGYSDTMTLIDQANPEDPADSTRNVYLLPRNEGGQLIEYHFNATGRLVPIATIEELDLDKWFKKLPTGSNLTTSAIHEEGGRCNMSRATIYRWIKRMIEDGQMLRITDGLYQVRPPQ